VSDFQIHSIEILNWLWLVPVLAVLFYYAAKKRRAALAPLLNGACASCRTRSCA